jgi:hypothetical protein
MLKELLQNSESLLWTLGILSFLTFILTLLVVPWLIIRIPDDYFNEKKRIPMLWSERHPIIRIPFLFAKNLLGGVLILLGIVLLITPGQGLLTILIGIILVDFPGKFRFERRLIQLSPVLRSVNWLRKKGNKNPLMFD